MAFVALEDWESARRAADWMLTFRYTYDVALLAARRSSAAFGFRTPRRRPGVAREPAPARVRARSACPRCVRLARATGDDHYRRDARENLACFRQFIAREDGDFGAQQGHGQRALLPDRLLPGEGDAR